MLGRAEAAQVSLALKLAAVLDSSLSRQDSTLLATLLASNASWLQQARAWNLSETLAQGRISWPAR